MFWTYLEAQLQENSIYPIPCILFPGSIHVYNLLLFRLTDTENKRMVTSGEGERGSTGVGELEGQTIGCKMGSRNCCTVWGVQPIFYYNCKWKVIFKNCIKSKKKKKTTTAFKLHDFLSGLVIKYLFGLQEKLSFKVSGYFPWRRQILEQFSLPWGESDGSLEVRDRWIDGPQYLWELCGNEVN